MGLFSKTNHESIGADTELLSKCISPDYRAGWLKRHVPKNGPAIRSALSSGESPIAICYGDQPSGCAVITTRRLFFVNGGKLGESFELSRIRSVQIVDSLRKFKNKDLRIDIDGRPYALVLEFETVHHAEVARTLLS